MLFIFDAWLRYSAYYLYFFLISFHPSHITHLSNHWHQCATSTSPHAAWFHFRKLCRRQKLKQKHKQLFFVYVAKLVSSTCCVSKCCRRTCLLHVSALSWHFSLRMHRVKWSASSVELIFIIILRFNQLVYGVLNMMPATNATRQRAFCKATLQTRNIVAELSYQLVSLSLLPTFPARSYYNSLSSALKR